MGSCVVTVSKRVVNVSSINLDKTSATLKVGEKVSLTATVKPDDATDKTVWSTSDASIAEVNNGEVTAKKIGTATITAKAGEKEATCAITVEATPVTSITLDQTSASLKVGEKIILTATVKPDDATDKTVTWSTSDASVAEVNNGEVRAKKIGTATITAKAGDKKATCAITVEATPVTSITLDRTSTSLKVGEKVTLTATVKPDDATDKTVTWSTSDASISEVNNGEVTAKKIGTSTITAKAGDKKATCAITVVATPVTSITLDKTSASLKVGEKVALTATVKPDDATDKTVTWGTSDASVVEVNNGVVTAKKIGTATITAKAGDKKATCAITVETTPVTSITLDKTSASLKVGEKMTLTATVKPDDATDKTVTWGTSDASVATVSGGVVTAIKPGSTTIMAKAGEKEASCSVLVEAPIKPLSFTASGSISIALAKVGAPNTISLEYSKDGSTWLGYQIGEYLYLSDGEQLLFRAGSEKNKTFSRGTSDYYRFECNGSGTISASGNVMTLLDRDDTTILSSYCFCYLFENCYSLTSAPEFPATSLARGCYFGCFQECQSLTTAPALPATTLATSCYEKMFRGCQSLTKAPLLPATTLADNCYDKMFSNCTSLTSSPALPATSLAEFCYSNMFNGCTSLISAPKLPATSLAPSCYNRLFAGCSSLATAPDLPATNLAAGCYCFMFSNCTALTSAPKLPATTLANNCYQGMFYYCSNLASAPDLPATTLATSCYFGMFAYCSRLTSAPTLPATYLVSGCYTEMFIYCSKLSYVKALFKTTPGSGYTADWLSRVSNSGKFVKSKDATWNVTGTDGIPSGWTVVTE